MDGKVRSTPFNPNYPFSNIQIHHILNIFYNRERRRKKRNRNL